MIIAGNGRNFGRLIASNRTHGYMQPRSPDEDLLMLERVPP